MTIALWVLVVALVVERVWALTKDWRWKRSIVGDLGQVGVTYVGYEAGKYMTGSNNTVLGHYPGNELHGDGNVILSDGLANARLRHSGDALYLDVDGKGLKRVGVTPLGTLAVVDA